MLRGMTSVARRAVALLAALLVSVALTSCSSSGGAPSLASATPAASAPAFGATLSAAEFASAMARPGTVLLDVRTPGEFGGGHLSGAKNLDVDSAGFRTALQALPKDVPYAVYCRSGNRSATALSIMKQLGFTSAYHLGGGIGAWTAAGGATVS
jgi:phage shock protein E